MARRRPRQIRVLLPGETEGRRFFIKKGLLGGALLLAGGGSAWLASRRTRVRAHASLAGPFQVFDGAQASVLLSIAERMIPERAGFPRPVDIGLPARMDRVASQAHPTSQKELKQLVGLMESALAGLLDGSPRLFTECDYATQGRRLRAWMDSRIAVRRTGMKAIRRLVYASYYSAPETWAAIGYPGPPTGLGPASRPSPEPAKAEEPKPEPPRPRRLRPTPVPLPPAEPVPPEFVPPVPGGGEPREP